MRIFVVILLAIIALLLVLCYSLCVVAIKASEKVRRIERAWKEQTMKITIEILGGLFLIALVRWYFDI